MSQQLHLFSNQSSSTDSPEFSGSILAQTRQLFRHQGSNAELIQRIKTVIKAIDERCANPVTK
jgi:uncharacterized protein YhaN